LLFVYIHRQVYVQNSAEDWKLSGHGGRSLVLWDILKYYLPPCKGQFVSIGLSDNRASLVTEIDLELIVDKFISKIALWIELYNSVGGQTKDAVVDFDIFDESEPQLHL